MHLLNRLSHSSVLVRPLSVLLCYSLLVTDSNPESFVVIHVLINEACACAARGVCVDKRTLQEQTALMLAVQGKHLDCVRILLEAGADPDISNKNKETPLYKGMFTPVILSVSPFLWDTSV